MPDPAMTRTLIHQGAKFDVERIVRQVDGRERVRDVVRHPGAVVVLPILEDGRYVLIRNYRPAVAIARAVAKQPDVLAAVNIVFPSP